MRERLKSSGCHWKLVWISAFLLFGKPSNAEIILRQDSGYCHHQNTTKVLECNLQEVLEESKLLEQKWGDIAGFRIIGASHLTIEPQCETNGKYLTIENSQDIRSKAIEDKKFSNCTVRLNITNSTAVNLDSLFKKVIARGSSIETIHQEMGHLDLLDNSVVADLRARSHTQIVNSEVKVVTELHIADSQRLYIADSMIGLLKKLSLNSSDETSDISRSVINEVSEGGIEIRRGALKMENVKFDYLSSKSITVDGGKLTMKNVNLTSVQKDSIIVKGDASILFENVLIRENVVLSFNIKATGSDEIWPLGVVTALSSSLPVGASIAIGFIVGVITVVLIIVVVHFSPCCPNLLYSSSKKDKVHFPLTAVTAHPTLTEPCPPTPLICDSSKDKRDDEPIEIYENYQDVEQPDVNAGAPQTGGKRFPPLPTSRPPPPVRVNTLPGDPYYDDTRDTADDQEDIYDECENVDFPPPPEEHLHMNSTFPSPPLHMLPANATENNARPKPSGTPVREEKSLVGKERDQKQLPPPNSKPSFLHAGIKPPPPPRVANISGISQVNNKPFVPHMQGQLPKWPPQAPADQSHFSGSLEDEEDIYEEVP